jgi:hypothetical protein
MYKLFFTCKKKMEIFLTDKKKPLPGDRGGAGERC